MGEKEAYELYDKYYFAYINATVRSKADHRLQYKIEKIGIVHPPQLARHEVMCWLKGAQEPVLLRRIIDEFEKVG